MYTLDTDGVDHINIYSKGKTELGRFLSNFYHQSMRIDGEYFESLEGYWYWLSTGRKHHELKKLYGFEAKTVGKRFQVVQIPDFQDLIKSAMRQKILVSQRWWKTFKDSTFPFAHYYVFGNPSVVRDAGFRWIVDEWERLRKEFKG